MAKTKTKTLKKIGEITSLEDAIQTLNEVEALKADAEVLMVAHGIDSMLEEADRLKKTVLDWAIENEVEAIPISKKRYYGLRRDTYNKRIIGTAEELADVKNPAAVIPLRKILAGMFSKKDAIEVWKNVTTRRVDEAKLQDVINEGILSLEDIEPAYYFDTKAPYIRPYGNE